MIKIGTSGWSYKEWEGVFYPNSKTSKLTYYSKIFDTAEIDSTFYANPAKGVVLGWVRNTPPHFEFAMKLPQVITHKKKLNLKLGVETDLNTFLDLIKPVDEANKMGPLLIQLPPSFDTSKKDILESFLKVLPDDQLFAVEFRNKSWLDDGEVHSLLGKYNVANTIVDEPLLPVDAALTAEFAMIRWHGLGERIWYDYEYSDEQVENWVPQIKEISAKVKKVYGYWNNHFHGFATENGLQLLQKLGFASEKQEEKLARVNSYIRESQNKRKLDDELI